MMNSSIITKKSIITNKSIMVMGVFASFTLIVIATLLAGSRQEDKLASDLKFSHKSHLTEHDAECKNCHADAATSTVGTDDLLPKEAACFNCHDKKDTKCDFCHRNGDKPVLLPRVATYLPKFNHKIHMDEARKHIDEGNKCETCHSDILNKTEVTDLVLPKMDKCMTCHETPETTEGCYKCHSEDQELKPKDHADLWKANHGSFHESGGVECKSCHTEMFCNDCHLGENLFNTSHPPEFIMTHAISYTMRESNCLSCHNGYQYCIECHTKVNYIMPMSHNAANWIATHQNEAKTNYDQCVVCHAAGDPTCGRCH